MNIFRIFESKKFMKICSKTHNLTNFFLGSMPPNPPKKRLATPRVSSPRKSWSPLANPAYVHGLLLRNLFGEMRS